MIHMSVCKGGVESVVVVILLGQIVIIRVLWPVHIHLAVHCI